MFKLKSLFIFFLIIAFIAVLMIYSVFFRSISPNETTFYIQENDSFEQIVRNLNAQGLIKNAFMFEFVAKKMNLDNKIHAGKYVFSSGANTFDLIRKLRGNQQTPVKFVLNNINFKEDLAGKVAKQLAIDSLTMIGFLNDEGQLQKYGYTKDNVMCVFIPNTYEFYWSISLDQLMQKMQKEHDAFWNENRKKQASELGLSTNEVFVLASIVEKEYKIKAERKRIAGVYLNRLRIGMPLQADPTCKFAWGDLAIKRVLKIHTQNPHPYNTYFNYGLPPGPICLPETSTITEVLNAEKHEFYYFCAHYDLDGKHEFNVTHDEHINAANRYQKALNKLNIY